MDLNKELIENCNVIRQVAMADLLDGRLFSIPPYQRGYRWGRRQVEDLCNDLLEYALTKDSPKSFYSLQPLIVLKNKFSNQDDEDPKNPAPDSLKDWEGKEYYDVIDGQQRLTTLFLLFRFLFKKCKYESLEEAKEDTGADLFHIFYATRPLDFEVMEKIGLTPLSSSDIKDIDIAHVANTLFYIEHWYKNVSEHPENFHYLKSKAFSKKEIRGILLKLLGQSEDTKEPEGNVQFVWYELDSSKDPVREFLTENKGKIQLTVSEKIKALFLQRSNFGNDHRNRRQNAMAKDWDSMEMALHDPSFWSILSDSKPESGRIEILFKYIYDNDTNKSESFSDYDDYLFRYFSSRLENLKTNQSPSDIKTPVDILWDEVLSVFRMFRNWFFNPKIYNIIGLLTKIGVPLQKIAEVYNRKDIEDSDNFILELNRLVSTNLFGSPESFLSSEGSSELDIPVGKDFINLFYGPKDKDKIKNILTFVNVRMLMKRIEAVEQDTDEYNKNKKASDAKRSPRDINSILYRFPFDVLDTMGWDIEHIDSATTNGLTREAEQLKFIEEAEKVPEIISDSHYLQLKKNIDDAKDITEREKALLELIKKIKNMVEEDDSEERKDWIGNLTLLDCGTNRSYKNKIYPLKQSEIQKRIARGVFIPICTANVFEKRFDGTSERMLHWSLQDKKAHHDFILSEIKDFISLYPPVIPSQNNTQND